MPTTQEIQTLIEHANQSLHLKLTAKQLANASRYLQEQAENNYNFSPALVAQVALYGVMVAGGYQPVVQTNWGNPRFAIDYNSEFGGRGGASIDNDNRIDFTYGDPLGVEMDQIESLISNERYSSGFLEYLQNNHYLKAPQPGNQKQQRDENNKKSPELKPKPPTSIDPF